MAAKQLNLLCQCSKHSTHTSVMLAAFLCFNNFKQLAACGAQIAKPGGAGQGSGQGSGQADGVKMQNQVG